MRTNVVSIALLLALLAGLVGCGGGSGSGDSPISNPPSTPPFTPVAKFTASELTANTIYGATSNTSGVITAYTFSPDGTVTEVVNMTTTSTSPPAETLVGTYFIDASGILVINIPLKATEQIWKTTAAPDAYNSFSVASSASSVQGQWFFDETLAAPQALAFAQGTTPYVTTPAITNANSTVFTVGTPATFAVTATGTPSATFSILETLPPGISFNTKTGILSGTPTAPGTYTLTITASNGVLPNATQTFFLPVNPPTTPITVPKTWSVQSSPGTQNLRGVVWTGTQFIAVGDSGTILTSANGSTWAKKVSGSAESLWSVAWSGTRYVVVGDWNGNILTSVDGTIWTITNTGISKLLRKVIWANNQFIAVGAGTILTSPDGTIWTQRTVSTDKELSNVVWTGAAYVAIGGSNGSVCLTSTDGSTWVQNSGLPASNNEMWFGLAWNGSLLAASGVGGIIATSSDADAWVKTVYGTDILYAMTFADNNFIAVGNNGRIITSPDGTIWTTAVSNTTSNLQDIACSTNACVAVGGATNLSTIMLYQ